MFYVYVLKSIKHQKSYVGYSGRVNKRLSEHNAGLSYYTKRYKPWKLIYKEPFNIKSEAILRERYLKSRSGRRWLKNNVF